MAITQGINGTLVTYEYIEPETVIGIRKITKKVSVNGVWEDRTFIMLTDGSGRSSVQSWLKEHYGPSVYGQTWWPSFNSVCMSDKIYTHWKLME
jgi:hypothetical protein